LKKTYDLKTNVNLKMCKNVDLSTSLSYNLKKINIKNLQIFLNLSRVEKIGFSRLSDTKKQTKM